jgi:outer membrane receptor protein involved in Fe transport
MKNIYLLLLLCFISEYAFSQRNTTSLTGLIIDQKTSQPIEFATIQLIQNNKSAFIKSVLSSNNGKFLMDSIMAGTYLLRINYMGLIVPEKELVFTSNQGRVDLGIIEMNLANNVLADVIVTAKKSMLNTSIDRKVYNTAQDIMAQSGSVSDILRNIPSVEIDIEGNISLRGSGELMVLINGRPSPLMGKNRAEVLQQIPANTIERIEVITNPSARFRPDGSSGIVNIVLKKNTKAGFNGNITGNIGNKERSNGSLTLNYKKGNWNSYATYGIRQDERNRFGNTERQFFDSAKNNNGSYAEQFRSKARPLSQLFRAGIDYTINNSNSVGISGSILKSNLTRNDRLSRIFFDNQLIVTSQLDRLRYAPAVEYEKDATIYWQHNFIKEGHELRVEATTSSQSEDEKNTYTNQYYFPQNKIIPDNNWVNQIEVNKQVTVDYTNPIAENAKIELGYAGSFVKEDIDFYVENFDPILQKLTKNTLTSNHFLFNQRLHAFYGTFYKTIAAFSYSLGLRAEQSYITSNLITSDSVIKNQYFQIFPTMHLAYKLKKGELQLNYSKRVNRPEGDDLNPFPEYMDPLNLRAGNPKLLPEYIHSVEFGYQWKNKIFTIVPSIYYRYKYNGFTALTKKLNDSAFLTTKENLSNDQSTGLELVVSAKPSKFITANLNTNFFLNTINFGTTTVPAKKSMVTMSTNFNASFTITPTTMLQFSCIYRSARQTIQGEFRPTIVTNLGIRQELLNRKLSVVLTLSDVFRTLKQKSQLNTLFLNQISINSRDAQVFYVGFNYRFGSTGKKPVEEKMQYDNAL